MVCYEKICVISARTVGLKVSGGNVQCGHDTFGRYAYDSKECLIFETDFIFKG